MSEEILTCKEHNEDRESEEKEKMPPWGFIFLEQDSFHNDLDCIREMLDLVLPVLNQKDLQRKEHITQIKKELNNEDKDENREVVINKINNLLGHLSKLRKGDRMFRQGIVILLVSKFDEFLIDILRGCYKHSPGRLINDEKKLSYRELLEIDSLDLLKDNIIQKEIDVLMRDSHYKQIKFLDSKFKLGIEKEFSKWLEFLEITERRNLFVHTGGIVSPQYLDNCNELGFPVKAEIIVNKTCLSASNEYINAALDCFYELSVRIAQAVTRRLFPDSYETADYVLNNSSVDLLIDERWELAERIFDFALSIPKEFNSKKEWEYYFLINRCIALKFAGKPFNDCLHSVDWSPFHPLYHFAVAILEDDFDEAERLMRTESLQEKLTEERLKTWPLLREFKKTNAFQKAFKDIYGKDFNKELLEDVEKKIKAQEEIDTKY